MLLLDKTTKFANHCRAVSHTLVEHYFYNLFLAIYLCFTLSKCHLYILHT